MSTLDGMKDDKEIDRIMNKTPIQMKVVSKLEKANKMAPIAGPEMSPTPVEASTNPRYFCLFSVNHTAIIEYEVVWTILDENPCIALITRQHKVSSK
jgi:hypothetical protein